MSITSAQGPSSAGDLAEAGELAALGVTLAEASPTLPELERILAMTTELFPGQASVRRDFDPDFPADAWYVVEVEARGGLDQIADRELQWHDRLRAILGDEAAGLRLIVDPV